MRMNFKIYFWSRGTFIGYDICHLVVKDAEGEYVGVCVSSTDKIEPLLGNFGKISAASEKIMKRVYKK